MGTQLDWGGPVGEEHQYGARLANGCAVLAERRGLGSIASASGQMALSYFRAPASFTAASVRVGNTTAAAATPTLCRVGLYSVAANGDLSLLAATANDTTLFSTTSSDYARAFAASAALVQGAWYALGVLVVSAAGMPMVASPLASGITFAGTDAAPRLAGVVNALADLPASVASAAIAVTNAQPWAELRT